jgi:uncharacterized membrane protein
MGPFPDLPHDVQTIFSQRVLNCHEASELFHALLDLNRSFVKVTEQDPILLCLISVMLLFSTCILMAEDKVRLNDSLAVHWAQSHHVRLIWNYLMDKHSENNAIRRFTQLMDVIL